MSTTMPTEGGEESYLANADLSAKQNYIVFMTTTADTVDLPSAGTEIPLGVLANKPKAGEAALVQTKGTAKIISSGTIAVNAKVGTDSSGKAVAKTADHDWVIGIVTKGGSAGELLEVLLTGPSTLSA